MDSQLSIRLPKRLSTKISNLAKKLSLKRSDIARMALEKFLEEFSEKEEQPYKKVKNLIGGVASGVSDLGESHRKYLLKRFKKDA